VSAPWTERDCRRLTMSDGRVQGLWSRVKGLGLRG